MTYTTTDTPRIYVLDYGGHLDRTEGALDTVRQSPPEMLHTHGDMPILSWAGPSQLKSLGYPFAWSEPTTAETVRQDEERVREFVSDLHAAGVETVFPYMCNQTMGGDPEKRTGMWWYHDRRDEYDVIPAIEVDPIDWLQREPDGHLHFNYPYRFPLVNPPIRFAPCPNNPHWHDWLQSCARRLASYGYDGTFVDNNIIACYCEHCERQFPEFLREEYTPEQLRQRYGDDVDSLRMTTRGSRIHWAQGQPGYLRQIHDEEPEEFREKFGTDDIEKAVHSEAGEGFHWGRSSDYWQEWLKSEFGVDETTRILREGDVSTLNIGNPRDLCLWADTQKFRAWSIGKRNAEIRAAAREVHPGFIMVPNWGDTSGVNHVNSRRVSGKNVRLWKPGSDVLFYEESWLPGTLAPGYTLDLIPAYKIAVSCGMRSCALRTGGSADMTAQFELATAESAAFSGDGMFAQPGYGAPEMRALYRDFFETHRNWFADHETHADVGIAFSFDELHLENMHHLREAYPLMRYLADHHVLFDVLNERSMTTGVFAKYRLVILPHVQYLSEQSRVDLLQYASNGGRVVVTGNTGAFDEHARPFAGKDDLSEMHARVWNQGVVEETHGIGEGSITWIRDVANWMPRRAWQIHDLMDYHVTPDDLRALIPELRTVSETEPTDDPRLSSLFRAVAGCPLSIAGNTTPSTLRVAAWKSAEGMTVHLVNFDVPGPLCDETPIATPVENVEIRVRIPGGMTPASVVLADPWHPDVAVNFDVDGGCVRFAVPRVDVYKVVRVE